MNERFELRQVEGAPADQRVIGIVGDEQTVVAGVPYGTDEEKRRAVLLVAAPQLLQACRSVELMVWRECSESLAGVRTLFDDERGDLWRGLAEAIYRADGRL